MMVLLLAVRTLAWSKLCFPTFFHNTGHYANLMSLCAYFRLRCTQLFSPFKLCKNCLLLMYHVRQAHILSKATSETVLQRDMDNYARHNPNATQQQVLHNVLKHSVPPSVPGSPAYFRKQLQNLLAMVANWGLPHFFLTLTADEAMGMRWTEITDLETLLHAFNNSFSFRDAPMECATHFLRRCKDFLAEHILGSDGGILGRVKNYVIRYEVQDRGSLHAHIVIWLEPADVNTTAAEISACIPATFHEATDTFTPPTDPHELALYNLVIKKQRHTCCPGQGLGDTHTCRYGFPQPVQPSRTPVFQPSTNRYLYYRPRHAVRNVVPYHPVVLLLWKAHMNLQRITQTAWSFYVLKYAMKAEPAGHLRIEPDAMAELGLSSMSSAQLATASALILSKPICPAEATMIFLEEPAMQASASVLYIASAPPVSANECYG